MKHLEKCSLPRNVKSGIWVSHLDAPTSFLRPQRGLNEHPLGSEIIEGGCPGIAESRLLCGRSILGTEATSPWCMALMGLHTIL